jgi:transposase InsO family protein
VPFVQVGFQVSERRACHIVPMQRSTYRYRSIARDQTALRMRLRDLAAARVRYGYRRLHVLLQREGWQVNHTRVYRGYRLEGLSRRVKSKKKRTSHLRVPRSAAMPLRGSLLSLAEGPFSSERKLTAAGAGDAEKAKQQFESAIAAGRYGTPEEVTALVAFLASGAARYVNGAVYTVDRGYTAI